jgi:hypothetical protein
MPILEVAGGGDVGRRQRWPWPGDRGEAVADGVVGGPRRYPASEVTRDTSIVGEWRRVWYTTQ